MNKEQFLQDLSRLVSDFGLDKKLQASSTQIAQYILSCCDALSTLSFSKKDVDETTEFVERMYSMYPPKCPKRGVSLGKSHKDKQRIKKLLKTYSMEQIEDVFVHEIEEKFGKQYMLNFSTFLNNFPDPNAIKQDMFVGVDLGEGQSLATGDMVINGVIYR